MDIEARIRGLLTDDATVASLLAERIYPGQAPQSETFPLAVYQQTDNRQQTGVTGTINLYTYSMRFDVFALDYEGAKAVYNAIRDVLVGYRSNPVTDDRPLVRGIFEDAGDDEALSPIHADEQGYFRAGVSLNIWYSK